MGAPRGWQDTWGEPAWLWGEVGTFVRTGLGVGYQAEAGEEGRSTRGAGRPSEGRSQAWSAPGVWHCRPGAGPGNGWKPPPQASPPTLPLAPWSSQAPKGVSWGDNPI